VRPPHNSVEDVRLFAVWHAFIGEEFDDAAVFNFLDFDTFVRLAHFCPPDSPGGRFRQLSLLHTETVDVVIISMPRIL
jgi:hypothetical protein